MTTGRINKTSFIANMRQALDNTLNFENHSTFTDYNYEDTSKVVDESLGLCQEDDYIVNNLMSYLKVHSNIKAYTKETASKYYYNPVKLSMDTYGTIDYWWVILCANGYFNARDFHDFTELVMPDKSTMENIIDKELYAESDIGVIPNTISGT